MPPIATTQLPNKIFQFAIIDIDASLNTNLQDLDLKIMSAIEPCYLGLCKHNNHFHLVKIN